MGVLQTVFLFFFKDFIYFQREGKGEREGEKHKCVVTFGMPPTGDLACYLGMCPDWELNWRPFGSQACAQSTEHTSQGCFSCSFINFSHEPYKVDIFIHSLHMAMSLKDLVHS